MREFKEFDNWASNVVESAIYEKREEGPIKREIPQAQDIVYQARRKYPDLEVNQALSLFLADKLEDFDRRDLEQNAVINAQRRENAKLNQNLTKLQQELDGIEASSERTDSEIERLKALSGKLSTDIEQRKISARDIERALAQVEELRNKPGMDNQKYQELVKRIDDAEKNPKAVKPEEFEKFTKQLQSLSSAQTLEREQLNTLMQQATSIRDTRYASQEDIAALTQQLQAIKDRPNVDSKQIEDLQRKINNAAALGISQETIDNLNKNIQDITDSRTGAAATIEAMRNQLKKEKEALASQEQAAKSATKKFGEKEIDLAKKVQELAQREEYILKTIDILKKQEDDLSHTIATEKAKTAEEFKKIQSKYRKAVKTRSKQASTLIRQFLNQEYPKFKEKLEKLNTELPKKIRNIELSQSFTEKSVAGELDHLKNYIDKFIANANAIAAVQSARSDQDVDFDILDRDTASIVKAEYDDMMKRYRERSTKMKDKSSEEQLREDLFDEGTLRSSLTKRDYMELSVLQAGFNNPKLYIKDKIKLLYLKQLLTDDKFLGVLLDLCKFTFFKDLDDENFFQDPRIMKIPDNLGAVKFFIDTLAEMFSIGHILMDVDQSKIDLYAQVFNRFPKFNWMDPPKEFMKDFYERLKQVQGEIATSAEKGQQEFSQSKFAPDLSESIESMVDNIIGEQVARWIK